MDKTIDDLLAAEAVTADDLFVVQQNGTAKKVSGDILRRYVGEEADLPKPDGADEGAFLRVRNKKWVAEKSPVLIDLYSAGVNIDPLQPGTDLSFDVPAEIVTQFVAAAKNGGALLKFGFGENENRLPAQVYLIGGALESWESYQLSGKMFFKSSGFNVSFTVDLKNSNTSIISCCTFDSQLPDPGEADDGAFLRAESGKWVASKVPMAEGGTF